MKKKLLLFTLILLQGIGFSQIRIIGHNEINKEKLINTQITIKEGASILKTFNTKSTNDFKLELEFGKVYRVYFQNRVSPIMFLEVIANDVPREKQEFQMTTELFVQFYDKKSLTIDTNMFSEPFDKIVFDGRKSMKVDMRYRESFLKKLVKKEDVVLKKEITMQKPPELPVEVPVTMAGRAILNNNIKLPIIGRTFFLTDKNNRIIKTTKTNRFGAFALTGIKFSEFGKLKMESPGKELKNGEITIINSAYKPISTVKCDSAICDVNLSADHSKSLIDNNYSTNIGGKIIISTASSKRFFSNKTVYLSNKRNTVIRKTTTSLLGTFVFEEIKPDDTYFIGIDEKETSGAEKIDLLNKDDKFIANLDTIAAARKSLKVNTNYNKTFNDISIGDDEMKMNVKAKLYGDNTNNPIGKLKILLLNETYQIIDTAVTDDFGTFKFKYLPFLKRFYLSAENVNNILDVFTNILVYGNDNNLIKIMTHQKGDKFVYKPLPIEMSNLKEVEIDDPWLDVLNSKKSAKKEKVITENILFESNKHDLLPQGKEILDKIILVLNDNKKIKLELGAHTDSKGNDAANLKLSNMRANSVKQYLAKMGIEEFRLISIGYGETKPVNKCINGVLCDDTEYAQNRRVEFKILEQ